MKNGLKLVLGLSLLSFTNEMMAWDECCCADVFVGAPCYSLDVGFRAIAYKPAVNNLDYAVTADPLPILVPQWRTFDVQPNYNFGFEVDLTAVFHDRGTKLAVSWEHFENNDSSRASVPTSSMLGPFLGIGRDAALYERAHGKVKWYFDQINLDYGTYVNFGECFQANLFVGLTGARIKETRNTFFSGTLPAGSHLPLPPAGGFIGRNIDSPITFTGGGPRIGLDFSYTLFDDFRLTGQAAAAIFVGNFINHTKYASIFPGPITVAGLGTFTSPTISNTQVHNRYGIVPEFEGRLGFAYDFTLCDDFFVKLEAGYEAKVFIGALQSVEIGSEVVTPPVTPDVVGVFARTFERKVSDFALAGPYVSINVGF